MPGHNCSGCFFVKSIFRLFVILFSFNYRRRPRRWRRRLVTTRKKGRRIFPPFALFFPFLPSSSCSSSSSITVSFPLQNIYTHHTGRERGKIRRGSKIPLPSTSRGLFSFSLFSLCFSTKTLYFSSSPLSRLSLFLRLLGREPLEFNGYHTRTTNQGPSGWSRGNLAPPSRP